MPVKRCITLFMKCSTRQLMIISIEMPRKGQVNSCGRQVFCSHFCDTNSSDTFSKLPVGFRLARAEGPAVGSPAREGGDCQQAVIRGPKDPAREGGTLRASSYPFPCGHQRSLSGLDLTLLRRDRLHHSALEPLDAVRQYSSRCKKGLATKHIAVVDSTTEVVDK